jgi:hypothetical protein
MKCAYSKTSISVFDLSGLLISCLVNQLWVNMDIGVLKLQFDVEPSYTSWTNDEL